MKIAIVDDDFQDIRLLRNHLEMAEIEECCEVEEFTSALPFLRRLLNGEAFDVVFLDKQMPDSDGWEIAKTVKGSSARIYVAMLTIHGGLIENCFDRVDWFAAKPVSPEKVLRILENAREKLFPATLELKCGSYNAALRPEDISHAEVMRNKVLISALGRQHTTLMPMRRFKELLAPFPCFAQPHQSYMVNLRYFCRLEGRDALLTTGDLIPISRTCRKAFMQAYASYLRSLL
jgi:DNA-binding LytR/AlgR family response regulator